MHCLGTTIKGHITDFIIGLETRQILNKYLLPLMILIARNFLKSKYYRKFRKIYQIIP